ncbi:MAG: VOC family protein [Alicyclobacillus macrosporangiidus]|uniref:VOC family protein n=1 Tax=Alicyclobacillus macrosporangiidus TaxID=392015 RepID=UPI0026E93661|nr:VOC family protein [Alicyclobacillus macrosporangiidus]MCL6600339.1 VOC family protein [Alicyclobacillus macrosporangiidus]
MKASLDGVTLQVSDVERSCDFYSKIPGAEVVLHIPGRVAILRIGEARIGLIGTGEHRGFHLELLTEHLDDMYDALRENGLKITGKPTVRPWGERTFILLDPDGYPLEFEEIEPGHKHV